MSGKRTGDPTRSLPMSKHPVSGITRTAIFYIAAALLLYGCGKPMRDYGYISMNPAKGWEKNKELVFTLDMKGDTAHTYAIYFTAEIKNNQRINEINAFPVEVIFESPYRETYSNIISLPINVTQKEELYRLSKGIMEIEWPYLRNIRNKTDGTWRITIKQTANPDIYRNITGFGVCYKEE